MHRALSYLLPLLLGACLWAPATASAKPETPTTLEGGEVIDVGRAHQLMQAGSALFIDTRSPLNFGKGHIPGAVTIAYREKSEYAANFDAGLDEFEVDRLPADRSKALVFYSDGPTGWKSYKAAVLAIRRGHHAVYYLRDGWTGWAAAGLPVEH